MPWQSVPPLLIITAAFGAIGGGLIGIDYLFMGRVRCVVNLSLFFYLLNIVHPFTIPLLYNNQ
jgi:hypothetical protein